jgi:hypothetical protein
MEVKKKDTTTEYFCIFRVPIDFLRKYCTQINGERKEPINVRGIEIDGYWYIQRTRHSGYERMRDKMYYHYQDILDEFGEDILRDEE